jgi:hypothetical protein
MGIPITDRPEVWAGSKPKDSVLSCYFWTSTAQSQIRSCGWFGDT